MPSFLEDENQMIIDAAIQEISDQLFDDWIFENSDEGPLYLDYKFAVMSNDPYIKQKFNSFYELQEGDEFYV
jgi:hypothetical protein